MLKKGARRLRLESMSHADYPQVAARFARLARDVSMWSGPGLMYATAALTLTTLNHIMQVLPIPISSPQQLAVNLTNARFS